jgi:hypothetical protein
VPHAGGDASTPHLAQFVCILPGLRALPSVRMTHARHVPSKRPPPPQPKDLDEVERALSVLDGRHPEHEKSRRETAEAARKRSLALATELAASARRKRRRAIVLGANAVAIGAVAFVGWRLSQRTQGIRAGVVRAEGPWTARGFAEIASNALTAGRSTDLDLPEASCFAAVTEAAGPLRVRQGDAATEGARSVAWCSCAPAHVTVEAPAEAASLGFAVLRADARALGGPLARGWLDFAPGAWAVGGDECAEATLDAWIADHRWASVAVDTAWLAGAPARASLGRNGFDPVPGVAPGRPFGVVEGRAGACFLAASPADEPLSLRTTGGARRVRAKGAIGWCTAVAATTTVWRDGQDPVAVVSAAADRIGGLLGLHEAADDAGVALAADATWVDDADLAWSAGAALRSSGLPDAAARPLPPVAGTPDARLVALTLASAAVVAFDPASVVVACDPPLAATAGVHSSVCATSQDVAWWRKGDAAAAQAVAALPVWLAPLEPHREPDAVARVPEILSLARRLARAGFTPTVLEGVTELADGVRVIGRAGEDAVVALGVGQRAPWVFPYTNGVPWDLGDPPVVVPIKPGETAKLTAFPLPNTPPEKRRTVVFRRAAGAAPP